MLEPKPAPSGTSRTAKASATHARPNNRNNQVKTDIYSWDGTDRLHKKIRGEIRAASKNVVIVTLRKQGIKVTRVKKLSLRGGRKIKEKEIAIFTRQLATMSRAGVPILQAFDIAIASSDNPRLARTLNDIKNHVESGHSLAAGFRRHPILFNELYCNLIAAGEHAGILDNILERLAVYKEKMLELKGKVKTALFYPAVVMVVASLVIALIMWFVVPRFKEVFAGFGAELPWLTNLIVIISDAFVNLWWLIVLIPVLLFFTLRYCWRTFPKFRYRIDVWSLKIPVLGKVLMKAAIARWSRTLATMFAAGVPLVEALKTVGGSSGNLAFAEATERIQTSVATGTSLTVAMDDSKRFPPIMVQMSRIGEETGALDTMLSKVADYFEREVDESVDALASLIEPLMIVVLGVIIGVIVVAIYLPIFKLGAIV